MEVCQFCFVDWREPRVLVGVLCAFDAGFFQFQRAEDDGLVVVVHFCSPWRDATCNMEYAAMSVKALSRDVTVRMPYWSDPVYPGIEFDPEEGQTKQSFKDECDINNIMKRYNATGAITHLNMRTPEYGDFSSPLDFQSALNTVMEGEAMFADLPSYLRDRFGNDPKQLLEFLADDANREEAIKLGIVQAPPEPPAPVEVRVVDPIPSPPQPKAP